jgi:hypothetical protein
VFQCKGKCRAGDTSGASADRIHEHERRSFLFCQQRIYVLGGTQFLDTESGYFSLHLLDQYIVHKELLSFDDGTMMKKYTTFPDGKKGVGAWIPAYSSRIRAGTWSESGDSQWKA